MTSLTEARCPNWRHFGFACLVAITLPLFWPALACASQIALHSDDLSYLLLIAPISLGLLWLERREIFAASETCLFAIPFLLAAIVIYLAAIPSKTANDESLAMLALVFLWLGGFLFFYGPIASQAAIFPLFFLILAVPPPPLLLDRLVLLLRCGSTDVLETLFRILGVPVFRDGFIFYVRDTAIEVATQCSGTRSFLALIITALLLGHFFLRRIRNKMLLVVLAIPLAILKNAIRIVTLTLLAAYVDPQILNSSLHRYAGIPLFLLSFLIVFYLAKSLQKAETLPSALRKGVALLWTTHR